ncbi:MAG: trehalose-6-phosphate synthase [Chloroflexi bacterium]|nr:trehalose-6-phosphate synthase [Chloroflexota bacterium]
MADDSSPHLIIVSNRGPYAFHSRDGELVPERGSGGLVTAIMGVAKTQDVLWISYALSRGDRRWVALRGDGVHAMDDMRVRLIAPDPSSYNAYYNVISNPLLWFVQHQLHDTPRTPVLDASLWQAWQAYADANKRLADAVAQTVSQLSGPVIVMPQDYHLYLMPRYLRERLGNRAVIQPFCHIPWPGPDAWRVLPLKMRREIVESMLMADRFGFQTGRDVRRFMQTAADVLQGVAVMEKQRILTYRGQVLEAAHYPISVDVDDLLTRRETPEVKEYVRQINARIGDRKLILRVDRVEPSKNILRGFLAYRNFLREYPEFRRKVEMLALLVPSRTEVIEYKHYLRDIMALVGEINATLGEPDWEPVQLMLGNNYDRAVAAMTRYDVLMVNPIADGMNLVAKEGAVLNQRSGQIILSEEAGAAEELGDAPLLVSPYDVYGMREAIKDALTMNDAERNMRATRLAEQVRQNDIHQWFGRQIEDAVRGAR